MSHIPTPAMLLAPVLALCLLLPGAAAAAPAPVFERGASWQATGARKPGLAAGYWRRHDATPPTIAIESATVTEGIVTMRGSAFDNESGLATVSVELHGFGGTAGSCSALPATWSCSLPVAAEGVYRAIASASDRAGNAAASPAWPLVWAPSARPLLYPSYTVTPAGYARQISASAGMLYDANAPVDLQITARWRVWGINTGTVLSVEAWSWGAGWSVISQRVEGSVVDVVFKRQPAAEVAPMPEVAVTDAANGRVLFYGRPQWRGSSNYPSLY